MRSTNFAQVRSFGSEKRGPMICRPTRSRAAVRPAGALAAGKVASDTRKVWAIDAYRRCRQMLSVVLGIVPSRETEAVHAAIARPT